MCIGMRDSVVNISSAVGFDKSMMTLFRTFNGGDWLALVPKLCL